MIAEFIKYAGSADTTPIGYESNNVGAASNPGSSHMCITVPTGHVFSVVYFSAKSANLALVAIPSKISAAIVLLLSRTAIVDACAVSLAYVYVLPVNPTLNLLASSAVPLNSSAQT